MRKIGESIIINGNIEVKLVEVKGKSAKIGFEFPPSSSVLRKEVHDRIVAENLSASMSSSENNDVQSDAFADIDLSKLDKSTTFSEKEKD